MAIWWRDCFFCLYLRRILYTMEKTNIISTSGAGIGSSIIVQGAVAPEFDMSQLASAITQLAIAVITIVQLLKKRKINNSKF